MPATAARVRDPRWDEKVRDATRQLLREAGEARGSMPAFFEFVMREEKGQGAIRCAPHELALFDFTMAFPQCVVRMPVGTSKTFCTAALTAWTIGQDVTARGAVVSARQEQARKPVAMVRDYIDTNPALRLVFPHLARSPRQADPWTQTAITVNRPAGIRDPSLVAVGIDGGLPGSRLDWILIDDILDRENTSTEEGLAKVNDFVDSIVIPRLNPGVHKLIVTNTPWHPRDLTYALEASGLPTLTMTITGDVHLSNVPASWDSPHIRPGRKSGEWYRLTAHDPDSDETVPLWPERFPQSVIDQLRREHLPHRFAQLYMCQCRDEAGARCKREWVAKCMAKGLDGVRSYSGGNPTITGVDLAVGKTRAAAATVFFTLELLPNGQRRILDVDIGQWDGPTIVDKLLAKAHAYNSIVVVENNNCQSFIRQFALERTASVPIRSHHTGGNKADPRFGVESLFVELQNGAWLIPCSSFGKMSPGVERFVNDCLNYVPSKHTGDALMAAWIAREQARKFGAYTRQQHAGSLGMNILAR